jgi:hypothetical protein
VPPCFDVYVLVRSDDRPSVLSRFIDKYVDTQDPGDPRLSAFVRTFVAQQPEPGDDDALVELRRDETARQAFSLYLRAKAHDGAIITITEEGDLVLGLSLDDPFNTPETEQRASALLTSLRAEFQADAGVAGVELRPPQSVSEWTDDALVQMRVGGV